MPVRAITFDFWCTLFCDPTQSEERRQIRIDALSKATGVSPERATAALKATSMEFARCHMEEQRTLEPLDAVKLASGILGVPVPEDRVDALADTFATAILEYPPEPVDGALDAVRAAAEYLPVGLVSDTGLSPGSSLKELLRRNGFLDYMDVLVFSDEVGVSKPQRAMFDAAADALNVAPPELYHLGDLEPTDIFGARNVGASAGLFTGENPRYLGNTDADHTFRAWPEFTDALPGIFGRKAR